MKEILKIFIKDIWCITMHQKHWRHYDVESDEGVLQRCAQCPKCGNHWKVPEPSAPEAS